MPSSEGIGSMKHECKNSESIMKIAGEYGEYRGTEQVSGFCCRHSRTSPPVRQSALDEPPPPLPPFSTKQATIPLTFRSFQSAAMFGQIASLDVDCDCDYYDAPEQHAARLSHISYSQPSRLSAVKPKIKSFSGMASLSAGPSSYYRPVQVR